MPTDGGQPHMMATTAGPSVYRVPAAGYGMAVLCLRRLSVLAM